MSQPPYAPPGNGYGLPLNPYGQPGTPLLSTQPLASSYDPYQQQPHQLAPQYYQQPPPHVQQPQQHPGQQVRLPSVAQGYPPQVQPSRPSSALPDPSGQGGAYSNGMAQPQRVATPGSYGLSQASGSASPAVSARAPPTPVMQGGQQVGGAGQGAQGGGQAASQQSPQQPQAAPKARSAMACVLCRRQKMKCEGPEKAPCRRCRAAQVECVFEAPPAAPPRPRGGGGVNEAYLEGRLSQFEQRILSLEEASTSQALVVRQQQQQQQQQHNSLVSAAAISDHERRLAALEAQLYALQLTVSRQQLPQPSQQPQQQYQQQQQQNQQNLPSMFSSPSNGPGLQALDQFGYATDGASSMPAPYAPSGAASASPALKHEPDLASVDGGDAAGAGGLGQDGHREKRWKGDSLAASSLGGAVGGGMAPLSASLGGGGTGGTGGEADFIARGVISEEEAVMCFDSYHLTFAHASSASITVTPPQPHLTFEETRRRSPLFLATVISIGARSLSRFATFHATYREAMRLAHLTFLPYADGGEDLSQLDPSSPASSFIPFVPYGAPGSDAADQPKPRMSTLSLKALMLLALYHSMPELLVHVFMLGYRFVLPTAMHEFERLSEEEKMGKQGRTLVNRGRVFLTGYLWLAFYSYCRGQQGFFDQPFDVLHAQLDVIRRSQYAEMPTDHVIQVNLEECHILLDAFKVLGPGMNKQQLAQDNRPEVYHIVAEALEKLVVWDRTYHDNMDILSQWGDSQELKSQVPLAHGRMALLMYVFRDIPFGQIDRENPQTHDFARLAVESALVILRWGVESRIWMPFSVVGGYVLHVNLPTSIFLLSTAAHLFPSDVDFSSLRPLLHRLVKQCDVTINHEGATPREIARAKRTKMEVLQLDRFAFEQAGDEMSGSTVSIASNGSGSNGLGGGGGGGGLGNGGGGGEDASLFGQEITASLDSLRLELNLWARPLLGLDDDV
ncbi:hypothetical protein JCM8547_001085 [Rhodosporidiobolus lusitaniae]